MLIGALLVAAGLSVERRWRLAGRDVLKVQRRPVAIALFVGFVIAYAQTAALFQVPLYFQLVLDYGPVLSVIATIPFMVALAVAGPIAGLLLGRFRPRTLIVAGILAVGLGSIVIAAILRPGAGVSRLRDLVRVDRRGLRHRDHGPDGDHLRERAARASGDGRGAQRGLGRPRQPGGPRRHHRAGHDAGARQLRRPRSARSSRRRSTPRSTRSGRCSPRSTCRSYGVIVGGVEASDAAAYAAAYTEAVRTVMFSTGILTLLAAPIAWIAIGGRDPLDTVWQHQDERAPAPAAVSG